MKVLRLNLQSAEPKETTKQPSNCIKKRFRMGKYTSYPFWIEAYPDGYVIIDADYVSKSYPHEGTVQENYKLALETAKQWWPDAVPDNKNW